MAIPSRPDAARLLRSQEPPAWFLRHACAVADVAAWLAARAEDAGLPVDRPLVEAAALLHDVDKLVLADIPAGLRHGDGSAAWLEAHGAAELAPVVRDHPVTRLAEPGFAAWLRTASLEARIVAYADKRAGQRLEPMAERFAAWRRRYPVGWDEESRALVERRALELERATCAAIGVSPTAVGRLRWSRRALREAAR
jgi:HD superfamily phosphodiesterase